MATLVVMPQMGYDMQEGTLLRWLKQEGEQVSRGEVIAEIETDKAAVEMEAFASGVLRKIVVREGVAVPVGETIAIIGEPDEELPEVAAPAATSALPRAEVAVPAPPAPAPVSEAVPAAGPLKASPVARRLADERGIDLRQVVGTGPGGRITRDDVLAYQPSALAAEPVTVPTPPGEAPQAVPLSRMRQAIARHTTESKQQIPHFYVAADIDMTRLLELRGDLNRELEGEQVRVSINDFVIKACARALVRYPALNATFQGDRLRMNPAINIGIAVALEEGLIVPAIPDCGNKSLKEIARASRDVVERAQQGRLRQEEYVGGTFSISNLGTYDVDSFIAIILPPQSAVLAVGTVRQQPVVRDGQVTIAQVMKATLSVDHRVADGAQASQFLGEIKRLLENPVSLLL